MATVPVNEPVRFKNTSVFSFYTWFTVKWQLVSDGMLARATGLGYLMVVNYQSHFRNGEVRAESC